MNENKDAKKIHPPSQGDKGLNNNNNKNHFIEDCALQEHSRKKVDLKHNKIDQYVVLALLGVYFIGVF